MPSLLPPPPKGVRFALPPEGRAYIVGEAVPILVAWDGESVYRLRRPSQRGVRLSAGEAAASHRPVTGSGRPGASWMPRGASWMSCGVGHVLLGDAATYNVQHTTCSVQPAAQRRTRAARRRRSGSAHDGVSGAGATAPPNRSVWISLIALSGTNAQSSAAPGGARARGGMASSRSTSRRRIAHDKASCAGDHSHHGFARHQISSAPLSERTAASTEHLPAGWCAIV